MNTENIEGYRTSSQFLQRQELLGAQQTTFGSTKVLRYPLGPFFSTIILSGEKGAMRLSWRDVQIKMPWQWTKRQDECDYVLALAKTIDESKKLTSKSARRALKQAEKSLAATTYNGKTITKDIVDAFYDVYVQRMKRFGSSPVPKKYIESQVKEKDFFIQLVREGDTVIAGATLNFYEGELFNELVASLHNKLSLRPNNLLYWEFIKLGHKLNAKKINYGPSPMGSKVASFKESMGGERIPVYAVIEKLPFTLLKKIRSVLP